MVETGGEAAEASAWSLLRFRWGKADGSEITLDSANRFPLNPQMKLVCWIAGFHLFVASARAVPSLPDQIKVGGFYVGCQAYSFKEYTAFEAIDKTAAAGGRVIEFFLWQPLRPETPNVLLDENLSAKNIALLKKKLNDAGIRAVSGYIRGTNFFRYGTNETALRKVFEFARTMEFRSLTGEPPEASFDLIEKLVKEYDLQFCLHNHRREESNPDYRYWDPSYNAGLLKKRDSRLGVCLDTGHLIRSGLNPVDAIKLLKDRVLSLHLKDPIAPSEEGHDTILGQGVGEVTTVLKELRNQNFTGHIALEYEYHWTNSVPDIAQSIDYLRTEGGKITTDAIRQAERAVSVPKGFRYEVLVQGEIPEPLDLEFCPDGRLWFTGRRGNIWAYNFETKSKMEIAHLRVPWEPVTGDANERGLHGIEFHPDYRKNHQLYLFYSTLSGRVYSNRVSRFTVDKTGNAFAPNSEKVLLAFPSTKGFHQGGAIEYNPVDRKLYISVGDNNPSGDTKKFFDDPDNQAQRLDDLRGKTLRLNLDGSIPRDNPFVKTRGARPEIFTYGHRNPYSMNVDFLTGNVYVGEVGYDRPEDFEEVNWLRAGRNYGWPRCIGPNLGTFGGDCPIPNATPPFLYYAHEKGGANATSGPLYRKNKGRYAFPEAYHDGMFYGDFSRKWIRFAQVNGKSNTVTNTIPFARGFSGPLSIQPGPDGGIYFAEYGGWFTGTPRDRISRIIYVGKESPAMQP